MRELATLVIGGGIGVVGASLAICMGQPGKRPPVDNAKAAAEMFERVAQPI